MSIIVEALRKAQQKGKRDGVPERMSAAGNKKDAIHHVPLFKLERPVRTPPIAFIALLLLTAGIILLVLTKRPVGGPIKEVAPAPADRTPVVTAAQRTPGAPRAAATSAQQSAPRAATPSVDTAARKHMPAPPALSLSGIMYDRITPAASIAVINDMLLGEGEEIEGATILTIREKSVDLIFSDEIIELRITR